MKLQCLGTGTCVPSLRRGSSSYLVSAGGHMILIDVGPSVVRRLLEFGHMVNDIDMIVLTHFHVDHTADLSTFLFASNYNVEPRVEPLEIVAGPGIHRFFRDLLKVYPWLAPKSYTLTLSKVRKESLEKGNLRIRTATVNHNPESIAVRIEDGKSLTVSGDTGYSKNLVKLATGTDLLVIECSFPQRKAKGHLNLAAIDRIVREAGPQRVVLTHLYPEWEDYDGVLHAPYLLAEDGMEMEL